MNPLTLMLTHIRHGWAVTLSDGRELIRFKGLCARRRAERYTPTYCAGRERPNAF